MQLKARRRFKECINAPCGLLSTHESHHILVVKQDLVLWKLVRIDQGVNSASEIADGIRTPALLIERLKGALPLLLAPTVLACNLVDSSVYWFSNTEVVGRKR